MIFKPEDFSGDWYGYLTNQVSHIGLGVVLAFTLCIAVFIILGEFPFRSTIFLLIVISYIIYELRHQKWKGWDTIEDSIFVSVYGAGGSLYSFHEVTPGESLVVLDIMDPVPFLIAAIVHLSIGVFIRHRKQKNDGR